MFELHRLCRHRPAAPVAPVDIQPGRGSRPVIGRAHRVMLDTVFPVTARMSCLRGRSYGHFESRRERIALYAAFSCPEVRPPAWAGPAAMPFPYDEGSCIGDTTAHS